jgi:hypothetical protein
MWEPQIKHICKYVRRMHSESTECVHPLPLCVSYMTQTSFAYKTNMKTGFWSAHSGTFETSRRKHLGALVPSVRRSSKPRGPSTEQCNIWSSSANLQCGSLKICELKLNVQFWVIYIGTNIYLDNYWEVNLNIYEPLVRGIVQNVCDIWCIACSCNLT